MSTLFKYCLNSTKKRVKMVHGGSPPQVPGPRRSHIWYYAIIWKWRENWWDNLDEMMIKSFIRLLSELIPRFRVIHDLNYAWPWSCGHHLVGLQVDVQTYRLERLAMCHISAKYKVVDLTYCVHDIFYFISWPNLLSSCLTGNRLRPRTGYPVRVYASQNVGFDKN